ncbi:hypothetical protein EPUL_006574 [Erysiphe pulchra]|uniref:Uncharacterized protein n=1 Tax=Erysiphe pulchra TaxID=225359 RepID=A0A2S4PKY4_9PEZI|nr:hypothetical protein EPUL_006574 [Erysiphe pulchra]
MTSCEREPASRHTRTHSYTQKPINLRGQSRDRSGKIFGKAKKVSDPETYGNQGAEFGVSSSNSNAGQVNRMNSNIVKLSDAYNQVVEENIPHSPVDTDVSKKNTSVETLSRIPTPTSRRTKNLSKSSTEEFIRPGRQMNERSQGSRFPAMGDSESDSSMAYGDGSPSPAAKTASHRTGNMRRTHSLSSGAHIGQTVQEKIETQSFRSQSDQKKKEAMLSNNKPIFRANNSSRKHPETPHKATNKVSKRINLPTTVQKKSSPSNLVVCSKAQNKIQNFEKIFSKELPHNSSNVVSAMEPIGQESNHCVSPTLDDNSSKPTTPSSIRAKLYDNQNSYNQNWEDSINFTTDNLTSSPKLRNFEKKLEIDSNPDTNSAFKIHSEYFEDSSSGKKIVDREFSPQWTPKSPPTSPSKNLSPMLDSVRIEAFKHRGPVKLSDMNNGSAYEGLQSTSNSDDISEMSQNTSKESHNEQTNKDVELKPKMPILDSENSSVTKKMQSASSAEMQSLADAFQKKSEKSNFNSITVKDQQSKSIIYPLESSSLINLEKKIEPKDSGKLPFESKLDVDPEERIAAEARLFEPQIADNKSEVYSTSVMSPTQLIPTDTGKNDETPRLDSKILPIETPKVVGAYVETPSSFSNLGKYTGKFFRRRALSLESQDYKQGINLNTKRTRLKDHSSSLQIHLQKRSNRSSAKPKIINTARRITASEDLRLIKKEENIQDSDSDSLIDEFANVNENTDFDELIEKLYNNIFLDPELDHDRSNLSQVKNERIFVYLTMERMKRMLGSASHSFHDMKNCLQRLEQQVTSTSPIDKTTTTAERLKDKNDCNAIPIVSLISSWLYIRVPSSRPEPTRLFRDRNWKFTWLGLTLLIFLLWYITELAMCRVFCHPKYSNKNTWQPSDPFFPWAIPTKLDQWTGRLISGGVETILDLFRDSTRTNQWPTHLYSGFDWWEGRSGPAAPDYIDSTSSHFGAANAGFGVGNIDDDEILK